MISNAVGLVSIVFIGASVCPIYRSQKIAFYVIDFSIREQFFKITLNS